MSNERSALVVSTATESRGEITVWDVYQSPLGPLTIQSGPRGVSGLFFPRDRRHRSARTRDPEALAPVVAQLGEYFAGERRVFDLPLDLVGTDFQLGVWHQLRRIPYGTTVSYSELAEAIGRPDVVRAVGAAVGQTPVPIVVPCHRVIGKDGSLTGYGGGLRRKAALLELERRGDELDPDAATSLRQLAIL
jgi:methylated-DNA-[protein]-cysteine S-methyltransferase